MKKQITGDYSEAQAGKPEIQNPKSKTNSKEWKYRNPKLLCPERFEAFRNSNFGFVSDFGFRIWDLLFVTPCFR